MSDPDAAIVARGLAAGYGSKAIWSDANFSIPSGSFTAVLGPNGAGKSTLFRLILGLLHPMAGKLEVFGEAARRGNPRIGYVPQGSDIRSGALHPRARLRRTRCGRAPLGREADWPRAGVGRH